MKIRIIIILFLCQAPFLRAQESDSVINISPDIFELMPIINPWLNTTNPAGHLYNPDINPGYISLNYNEEKGNFKPIMKGEELNKYSILTERFVKINNTSFFGSFSYNKSFEHGTMYTLVNNAYREIPYLLIDTTGRYDIYDREYFKIRGDISTPLNKNLAWGFSVKMRNGLSTQDRDPRPRNKVLNIDLSQGLLLSYPNLCMGANILYSYYNEEIEASIIEQNTQIAFLQLLGYDPYGNHKVRSYNRLYKRNTVGGEAQVNYNNGKLNSLLGGKFLYFDERIDDGRKGGDASWSFILNYAKLYGNELGLYNTTTLRKNNVLHTLRSKASAYYSIGVEMLRNEELIGDIELSSDWIDYGSEEKFASQIYQLDLKYSFLFLKDNYKKNFKLMLGLSYYDYYQANYVPYRQYAYTNRSITAEIEKTFRIKRHELLLGTGVKMKKNLSAENLFNESSFITQKILLPDFNYFTSDYVAPSVSCSYALDMNKLFDKYFIKANATFYRAENDLNRTILNFSTGVIFKN